MATGNVWFNTKQDKENTMTEEEIAENQIAEIKNSLPPEMFESFSKSWGDFIDRTSQKVEDENDYEKYLDVFMENPH